MVLLHGPPGTGKTRTLAVIAVFMALAGIRVLFLISRRSGDWSTLWRNEISYQTFKISSSLTISRV
jgi:DNA replication protein DnaC